MRNILSRINTFSIFLFFSGILCLIYIIIFVPVIEEDTGHYISLAKDIAYSDKPVELGNRSPLYPGLLALLIKIYGDSTLTGTVMVIQFVLVFLSSLFIYRLVETVTSEQIIAFLTGFLYLISISTINYGYLILTETLTLFLFILSSWLLIYYYKTSRNIVLISSGLVFASLILARYNTFLIPVFAIVAITLYDYCYKSDSFLIKSTIKRIILFSVPLMIILSAWSYRNYIKNDYFFLFSLDKSGTFISKNAIYASINRETKVRDDFVPLKRIVLDVQNDFVNRYDIDQRKGSLLKYLPSTRYIIMNNGFSLRVRSYKRFSEYYGKAIDIIENNELKDFEKNVFKNNRWDIFKIRLVSLFTGFRASSSSLRSRNHNINVLPSFVFIIYKILVIVLTILAYIYMIYKLVRFLLSKGDLLPYEIIIIFLTLYFPIVNFTFALTNDANRYKFPSEPFIIMFALLAIVSLIKYFKRKFLHIQTSLET